jgi:deoxycytidine triphosphate deaminase
MGIFTDQSFFAMQGKLLVIHPLAKKSVTAVGYDLRIGFFARINRVGHVLEQVGEVREGDARRIELPPNCYLVIVTREYVFLSCRVAATFHSKSSLAAQAVFLNSTTGDPNWSGRLVFSLYNASGGPVELDSDNTFSTMVVQGTERRGVARPVDSKVVLGKYMAGFHGEACAKIYEYVSRDDNEAREFRAKVERARRFSDRAYPIVATSLWIQRVVGFLGVPVTVMVILLGVFCGMAAWLPVRLEVIANWLTARINLTSRGWIAAVSVPPLVALCVALILWLVKVLHRRAGGLPALAETEVAPPPGKATIPLEKPTADNKASEGVGSGDHIGLQALFKDEFLPGVGRVVLDAISLLILLGCLEILHKATDASSLAKRAKEVAGDLHSVVYVLFVLIGSISIMLNAISRQFRSGPWNPFRRLRPFRTKRDS